MSGTTADAARAAITAQGHLGAVSTWMTPTVAAKLAFEELGPYKTLLKRFFSTEPWSEADAKALSDLVAPHLPADWWDRLDLDDGLAVEHGLREDNYVVIVSGVGDAKPSMWDRVFTGPVIPEPTPHPRKVKFDLGGDPAPGVWYRGDDEIEDPRVQRLMAEPDVTDVMVAGDFVTVGLGRNSSWEDRLDAVLALVTELFPHGERTGDDRTRDELIAEGRSVELSGERLHLLDPDDPAARVTLDRGLTSDDPRIRRIAIVVLSESSDEDIAEAAVRQGAQDTSRIVRRAAIDAGADTGLEALRNVFETALRSDDAWIRWKAVRSVIDLGLDSSRGQVAELVDDPDFQVRFEVARALRAES